MSVPQWVKEAVFYQIFPDRFANGDLSNDPPNVHPWGAPPTRRGFQGGDLNGITTNLDYLLDLGINAIYLNPIFMASSTHRYDTIDYFRIDPKLGDLQDFHELVSTAHRHNIRIILDGVFNHCSRGFFAFNDILENEADSPYLHWFHVLRFPLRAYDSGQARNFKAWWGIKSLPKLNTDYPPVRRYLLDVARYWIDQGADGWRLDVPNEIDDDSFWAEFRSVVHQANPEAYILGEIWEAIPRWVGENHFDGLMNYPIRTAILGYLSGNISSFQFAEALEHVLAVYPPENNFAMYNLLGSHDTERVLTLLGGDDRKVRLAFLFQFAFPGMPSVYYGDEIGLPGGTDPDCRRAFPWDQTVWNHETRAWIKNLIAYRRSTPALQYGGYQSLIAAEQPACYAYARTHADQNIIIVINASEATINLDVPIHTLNLAEGSILTSWEGRYETVVQEGKIHVDLGPWQGIYLA